MYNLKINQRCKKSVLFITLDSCRYDTFCLALKDKKIPNLYSLGNVFKALAPSYFTYGSHSAFWMGFTPGVVNSSQPWLNPKAGKLFRMAFAGHAGDDGDGFSLNGANIVEGFRGKGYKTIGSGAVDWFDPSTETGAVLGAPFERFYFPGNTWSLESQLDWIDKQLDNTPLEQPVFVFLNIGETHVPYWYKGAPWDCWPSPCIPFGGAKCSALESARRQSACLEWVDKKIGPLLSRFASGTILVCADHGDCWGEDGLWEHGISHEATLTVPLILRVRGVPILEKDHSIASTNPSRIHNAFLCLKRLLKTLF